MKKANKTIKNLPIQIVMVPVTLLKAANYNPRRWTKEALKNLMESIRRYGFCDPVIANNASNRMNIVIGGHMRLQAAIALCRTTALSHWMAQHLLIATW